MKKIFSLYVTLLLFSFAAFGQNNNEVSAGGGSPIEVVTNNAISGQTPITNPPLLPPVEGDEWINDADGLSWIWNGTIWDPRPAGGGAVYDLKLSANNVSLLENTVVKGYQLFRDTIWRDNFFILRGDTLGYDESHRSITGDTKTLKYSFCKDTIQGGYVELRAIPGAYICNDFYLQDWSLVSSDGKTYDMHGGNFRKVPTGTENGGTIISLDDGTIVERSWDKIHLQPEWWEVNGYSPELLLNNIIVTESDRINAAIITGGDGAVLEFIGDKEYELDKSLLVSSRLTMNMNHSVFKRINNVTSVLTAAANAGDAFVIVDDVTGLRVGQSLIIATGNALGQHSQTSGGPLTIGSIVGNQVNFTGSTINTGVPIGSAVAITFAMVEGTTSFSTRDITIRDGNFDGNKDNNTTTYDWRFNQTILLPSLGETDKIRITDCHFINSPVETIVAGGKIEGCSFKEGNGSAVHIQNNAGNVGLGLDTFNIHTWVVDCTFHNMMLQGQDVTGHSEAIIQTSSGFDNIFVDRCRFNNYDGGKGDAVGDGTGNNWKITNCIFEGMSTISSNLGVGLSDPSFSFVFDNNTLNDCGVIEFQKGFANPKQSNFNVFVTNNSFTNCAGIHLQGVIGGSIKDNMFKYNTDESKRPFFDPLTADATVPVNAVIYANYVDRLDISGNDIIGDTTIQHQIANGIFVDNVGWYNNGSLYGTNLSGGTREYWMSSIDVTSNTVSFFQRGICMGDTLPNATGARAYSDIRVKNNTVIMSKFNTGGDHIGILMWPGGGLLDNHVYPQNEGANYYPMVVKGIQNFPNINEQWGAYCVGNIIEGIPGDANSIYVTGFNCYVAFNVTFSAITGQGGLTLTTENVVENNRILGSGTPVLYNNPVRRGFHHAR